MLLSGCKVRKVRQLRPIEKELYNLRYSPYYLSVLVGILWIRVKEQSVLSEASWDNHDDELPPYQYEVQAWNQPQYFLAYVIISKLKLSRMYQVQSVWTRKCSMMTLVIARMWLWNFTFSISCQMWKRKVLEHGWETCPKLKTQNCCCTWFERSSRCRRRCFEQWRWMSSCYVHVNVDRRYLRYSFWVCGFGHVQYWTSGEFLNQASRDLNSV